MDLGNMITTNGKRERIQQLLYSKKEKCFYHNKGNDKIPLHMVHMYPTSHGSQANVSLQGIVAQNV